MSKTLKYFCIKNTLMLSTQTALKINVMSSTTAIVSHPCVWAITHVRLQIARLVENESEYGMKLVAACESNPQRNLESPRQVRTTFKILLRLKWQRFLTTRILFDPNTNLLKYPCNKHTCSWVSIEIKCFDNKNSRASSPTFLTMKLIWR